MRGVGERLLGRAQERARQDFLRVKREKDEKRRRALAEDVERDRLAEAKPLEEVYLGPVADVPAPWPETHAAEPLVAALHASNRGLAEALAAVVQQRDALLQRLKEMGGEV